MGRFSSWNSPHQDGQAATFVAGVDYGADFFLSLNGPACSLFTNPAIYSTFHPRPVDLAHSTFSLFAYHDIYGTGTPTSLTFNTLATPEPQTNVMLLFGLIALATAYARRHQRASHQRVTKLR